MAWVTPIARAPGFVVTASRYNQDVVDNILVLKTSIDDTGAIWSGRVDAVGQNHTFTFGTLNTIGPQVLLQSNMTNGSDYMGRYMFGLNTTVIGGMSAKEYTADTYGLGWHVFSGAGLVERMRLTGDGYLTCNTQPYVLAFNSGTDSNVGNDQTIDFDSEVDDVNGSFAADTFTALETGKYAFAVAVSCSRGLPAPSYIQIDLVTTARRFRLDRLNDTVASQQHTLQGTVITPMTAGDTAFVQLKTDGAANITGSSTELITFFSVRLMP